MKNGQITEAAKHLELKLINSTNNYANDECNSSISTTTNNGKESYEKRQEYWDRREKIIDER